MGTLFSLQVSLVFFPSNINLIHFNNASQIRLCKLVFLKLTCTPKESIFYTIKQKYFKNLRK